MKKIYRLRKRRDFNYTYQKGKSLANQYLVLVYRRTGLPVTRAGFSVSKKFGKSVRRNRIRRQLREIYRRRIPSIKEGFDLIFVIRKDAGEVEFSKLEEAVDNLLKRAGLFKEMD
ncbi:ribonuclease P protein component [Caldicoprobacter guelmensis]|uniref:ribonuclease P protein component n=1 Tax=Caldicoprobacter guelmensis TaxID=1170224 RepID=UPI00195EE565|nr:ribonuclease P protein component [Caldicoprobacter guelmensis]